MSEPDDTPKEARAHRGLGVRIVVAILLPTLMAFGFAAWISLGQWEHRQNMYRLSGLVGLADYCLEVAHSLQVERGLSVVKLAPETPRGFDTRLDAARRQVDRRLESLYGLPVVERLRVEGLPESLPEPGWTETLTSLRVAVDRGQMDPLEAADRYTRSVTRFVGCLVSAQHTPGQATITEELEDIQLFTLVKDSAGLERAFGAAYAAVAEAGGNADRFRARFLTQHRLSETLLDRLQQIPDLHLSSLLAQLESDDEVERLNSLRERFIAGTPRQGEALDWFELFTQQIDAMRAAERSVMGRLHDEAEALNRAARFNLWRILLLAIGLPVAVGLISLGIARHLMTSFRAQQHYLEHIRFLSQKDPLTGLHNRAGFHQAVTEELRRRRKRDRGPAALLLIDVNDFTDINRVWGERTGDMILELMAKRIQATLPKDAVIARIYGDHFAVLLETGADNRGLVRKMSVLCEHLEAPYQVGERSIPLRARVTASVFPADGENQEQLTRHAELARLAMIRDGEASGARLFDPAMQKEADRVRQLTLDLEGAVESGQFQIHYQPRIETATRQLVGMEALLRWEHPDHGFIPPDRFIPLAEEEGLIVDIGEWVIKEVCEQLNRWREADLSVVPVSVNLAAAQFFQADLVNQIRMALRLSDVPPRYLQIELTETSLMADHERAAAILDQLDRSGVLSAIDDFGTGYSSLSYLQRFAIHFLKIDKSFIFGLPDNRDSSTIVDAVIGLAHRMGLKVVAEGVEDEEQLSWLAERHCDEVQGYHFSRPQPAEQIVEWLERRN